MAEHRRAVGGQGAGAALLPGCYDFRITAPVQASMIAFMPGAAHIAEQGFISKPQLAVPFDGHGDNRLSVAGTPATASGNHAVARWSC